MSSRKSKVVIVSGPPPSYSNPAATYLAAPQHTTDSLRSRYPPPTKSQTQYPPRSTFEDPRGYPAEESPVYYNGQDYPYGTYSPMSQSSSRSNSPGYSYNSGSQSSYGRTEGTVRQELVRTPHPTGGRSGGPPYNAHGYVTVTRTTQGRTPVTVHNIGAGYRDPDRRPQGSQTERYY